MRFPLRLGPWLGGARKQTQTSSDKLRQNSDHGRRCFCRRIPGSTRNQPKYYGSCGGCPYLKPLCWVHYAPRRVGLEKQCRDWCVSYHGSRSKSILSIVCRGVQRPGDASAVSAHGQAYSNTNRSIKVSPWIEYAAFRGFVGLQARRVSLGPNCLAVPRSARVVRSAPWHIESQQALAQMFSSK